MGKVMQGAVLSIFAIVALVALAVLLQQLKPCNCHDEDSPEVGSQGEGEPPSGAILSVPA